MMQLQRLDEHSQHDQFPKMIQRKMRSRLTTSNITRERERRGRKRKQWKHTDSTLFSSFPGSDEIRQRNTAQARISRPASFISKTSKVDNNASISWTSFKEKTKASWLRNGKQLWLNNWASQMKKRQKKGKRNYIK